MALVRKAVLDRTRPEQAIKPTETTDKSHVNPTVFCKFSPSKKYSSPCAAFVPLNEERRKGYGGWGAEDGSAAFHERCVGAQREHD